MSSKGQLMAIKSALPMLHLLIAYCNFQARILHKVALIR